MKIREWINRDDGNMYQIGNKNLSALEIAGYFLLIVSMLIYLLHDKAGLEETWIGWLSLVVGVVLIAMQASRRP